MTPYSEETLVQETTADYLEHELGWRSLYAWNSEDFGPGGLLGRTSDREVVLRPALRQALIALNPNLPEEAYTTALREIVSVSAAQKLPTTNREKYRLIRDGVKISFRNHNGELTTRTLRLFDFDTPENNDFLCVRELWVRDEIYRRRADIVGFVNGLPLLFMELKNVNKDIRTAFEQNFRDYLDTIPHLFHFNAIVVLANGIDARIGSITSRFEHFSEWKRLAEEEPGQVAMETLLKGICSKSNFMDLLENFILFDDSAGEAKKIVTRNHQFLGVNRAVAAVAERESRQGRLGVFWHTQGSGKSYSMLFFTRKVHRRLGGNYTFVILTDRDDLDTQLYKTFAGCGVVGEEENCRAASGTHLARLLGEHHSHIFSLIQKFNQPVKAGEGWTQRDDIIVISDEAHRTQYGTLALNMRNALPNASYIGFTGTPLFKGDEMTRKVFGDYISTYDFQRAVEDHATVPLYYDARGDKLGIATDDLNERIADKLEELETDDLDVQQRLEQELKRDYHIITAGERLTQVAEDFVQHCSTSWESGKVMLVCIDKITCVRMYKLIDFYWQKRIAELEKELAACADEQEIPYRTRQLAWMRETEKAVIVSEEQGEVEKFRNWDLDITPHRTLIKEGMELPEAMRSLPQYRTMQRMPLDEAFKSRQHPFRIAIVCAMWLTGFDVPSLSTLYLDKPLKAHTLMQAIARANRVDEGKTNGMIVDYCGILKNLRQALATWVGGGDGGRGDGDSGATEPAQPKEELLQALEEAIALVRGFLEERGASLAEIIGRDGFERNAAIAAAITAAKEAANENDETRKRFEVMCRAVFARFKACLTVSGVDDYRAEQGAINVVYKSLQADRQQADISGIMRELQAVVDGAVETRSEVREKSALYDISSIDFERLRQEFARTPARRTTVQNLKSAIERRLLQMLRKNPLRTDFQQHYERIVSEYNSEKERVTIEQTFEALVKIVGELDVEERRHVREGLNEESLALFDLLKKPDLKPEEIKRIKEVAQSLLAELKAEKLKIDHWREKESTRDAMRQAIYDFLYDGETGLPESYDEEEIGEKSTAVFGHVFQVYGEGPEPVYAEA